MIHYFTQQIEREYNLQLSTLYNRYYLVDEEDCQQDKDKYIEKRCNEYLSCYRIQLHWKKYIGKGSKYNTSNYISN